VSTHTTESFLPLLARYRAVFFDAYGVLRTSRGWIPGVPALLARLQADGPPFWVVTNDASRGMDGYLAHYDGLLRPEQLVTASMLAVSYLEAELPDARVAYLGPPGCAGLLRDAGFEVLAFAEADDLDAVDAVAILDEEGWSWARELTRLVNLSRARPELPLLVPNSDLLYPAGEGQVGLGTGALAALLEAALGRAPLTFGKPRPEPFGEALRRARGVLGADLRADEVLMVGDSLLTDIPGAQAVGLATALVLSGNTPPDRYSEAIRQAGVTPTHVLEGVAEEPGVGPE
jgi:HAD superfamily hydrolase (TIGR01450 family)